MPGDAVRLVAPWSVCAAGEVGVIDGELGTTPDDLMVTFRLYAGRAFRGASSAVAAALSGHPGAREYVAASGGPATMFLPWQCLQPTSERTSMRFWRWKDHPRADGREAYSLEVPVWLWDGQLTPPPPKGRRQHEKGRLHQCEADHTDAYTGALWEAIDANEDHPMPTVGDFITAVESDFRLDLSEARALWEAQEKPDPSVAVHTIALVIIRCLQAGYDVYTSHTRTWVYQEPTTCAFCEGDACRRAADAALNAFDLAKSEAKVMVPRAGADGAPPAHGRGEP